MADIETKELTPARWRDLEKLFGKNGACGGCWCMFWRREKREDWGDLRGAEAKRRFRKLVKAGQAHGILAYCGGEPVGWCSYDRRTDFPRLDQAPSFRCGDAEKVWSAPCFFVKAGFRKRGVATKLLEHALKAMKKRGAQLVEGYPVKSPRDGKPMPAAFAWTGTAALFRDAGFRLAGNRDGGKQRVRKRI